MFSPAWLPGLAVDRLPEVRRADLISLFWVCGGYLSLKTMGRLLRLNKPVVWRLSDMWPFTGGCHYSFGCHRYEDHCGRCPQLSSSWEHDLSWLVMKRKKRWWQGQPLTVVCPSRWLAACARRSTLFREARIEIIPTGVDTGIFQPRDQAQARDLLQLPQDVPLILFGAINPLDDHRKGGRELAAALSILAQKAECEKLPHLVIFGTWRQPEIPGWTKPIHVLGRLGDDASLALAYAAADVFVAPSLEDNLPNTVIEAMACGLPCVAFNTGGLPDLIDAGENGYLAAPGDSKDLARGIAWVLADRACRRNLGEKARAKVARGFDLADAAGKYEALYQELCRGESCIRP
jgi:glycosyltransferase involved in cell wall biosynthesis